MRLKLIACEILYRECCAAIARAATTVDVTFLPKALHDIGAEKMLARLRNALDAVDESEYDAILLGYGLCNNGVIGLTARSIPLVLPRAHDCITLFLGDRRRYAEVFESYPGYYFLTAGWLERGESLAQDSFAARNGLGMTYEQMCEKYGEKNAAFLYEKLGNLTRNYCGFLYIETGVGPVGGFRDAAVQRAAEKPASQEKPFRFEETTGDARLIDELLAGDWNDRDFLVVPSGYRISGRFDDMLVAAEPIHPGAAAVHSESDSHGSENNA